MKGKKATFILWELLANCQNIWYVRKWYLFILDFWIILQVPEFECTVLAAWSQILAVRREYNAGDFSTMPLQCSYLLLRLDSPKLYHLVATAGCKKLTVWRECDWVYDTAMPMQSSKFNLRWDAPQFDCFVLASRN
jgi:hypothetical protein